MSSHESPTHRWLRQNIHPYVHPDAVWAHVTALLDRHRTVRPKTDVYTFDDGRTQLLLCLHGLLPIAFRGAAYHIPVAIWLPRDYPRRPPLAYVVPTSDMLVRPGPDMDPSGMCRIDYLRNWEAKSEGCSLAALAQAMQDAFSRAPPVYAKPAPGASPGPRSAPAPASPAPADYSARPPPPLPGAHGQHAPQTASPASPAARNDDRPPLPAKPGASAVTPVAHSTASSPAPQTRSRTESPDILGTASLALRPPPALPQAPGVLPRATSHSPGLPVYSPHPPAPDPAPGLAPATGRMPSAPANAGPAHAHGPYAPQQLTYAPFQPSASPPPLPPLPQGASPLPPLAGAPHQPRALSASPARGALADASTPPLPPPFVSPQPPAPFQPQPHAARDLLDADDPPAEEPLPPPPAPANAPPRPPNPELLRLHAAVHAKVRGELASLQHAMALDAERLRAHQADLLAGAPAVRDEMARLEAVRDVCRTVAARVRAVVDAGARSAAELRRKGDPEVDELVCSTTIVHNQLINLVAEDNAIEDTIYHLHRALNTGRIDLERFIRTTRVLAEEQFMKRALIEKIQAGLPGDDPELGWTTPVEWR